MKLYRNKKSGVECYMTDEEVQMMKDKKLFSNYTLVPNAKELNPTQPPDEILEFIKKDKAQKEATVGKSLEKEVNVNISTSDINKLRTQDTLETKPKPKRKRTKKENKDGNK